MTAIEFDNVGKQYRLGVVSTRTLTHDLNRWWQTAILRREDPYLKIGEVNDRTARGGSAYVWALKDINLKVEQGDVVGIIGKNGAGKSTLLKLLSRVTGPTVGEIRARGRIGALLEVGTGFHPEMTGRENIYLNGAILGMTKAEITRKLDEIVDFSGCERYIDTPVKRYSSGMMVRLGFAVAAYLDPEILVVDEVLAVGDAEFQKKAIGKMQSVSKGEGRTVLFVSHNMASIQQLCKTGVLIDKGRVAFMGTAIDTVHQYLKDNESRTRHIAQPNNDDLQLLEGEILSSDNDICYPTSELTIRMVVAVRKPIPQLVVGFNVCNASSCPIARADYNDIDFCQSLPVGTYELLFRIPPYTLATGDYTIDFDVAEMNIKRYTPDDSRLSFHITQNGMKPFGNAFNESTLLKNSLVRPQWLVSYNKID